MMMHSNIVKKISKELAETFIIIHNYLENYLSDLNVKVVNKEEFDYFCTALLFTICSNKLCAVDKKFMFSQFINSGYADIKIDYYSQFLIQIKLYSLMINTSIQCSWHFLTLSILILIHQVSIV